MASATSRAVLAAVLVALLLPPPAGAASSDLAIGAEAAVLVQAAAEITQSLSSQTTEAELDAAEEALVAIRARADAAFSLGVYTFLEADAVRSATQAGYDRIWWYRLRADVRADAEAAFDLALEKTTEAERRIGVDVTERGLVHARHQLRHAIALVAALEIEGGVDKETLADLKARILADLSIVDRGLEEARACACPLRAEVQTKVRTVVRAVATFIGRG